MTDAAIDLAHPADSADRTAARPAPDLHVIDGGVSVLDLIEVFSTLCIANDRVVDSLARESAITSTDLRALYFIAANADATPKLVAAHLRLTTGAMTALVDRVERAGYATRRPNPADRRSLLLAVTPAGEAAVERAVALYRGMFSAAIPAHELEVAIRAFAGVEAQLQSTGDELDEAAARA